LRVEAAADKKVAATEPAETKIGVAVCLKGYEYLSETDDGIADFRRISAMQNPVETQQPSRGLPTTPRAAS
jgi:hypothetical protein